MADEPPPTPRRRHERHRHQADRLPLRRSLTPALFWPAGALVVVGLVLLRKPVHGPAGPLVGDAFLLATGSGLPVSPVSPQGFGALLVAGYAELTRALSRHDALAAVDREVFVTAVLVAAVLLWGTARRAGLGDGTAAASVLLFGLPVALLPSATVDLAAVLSLPWLLCAAWIVAPGRPTRAAAVAALVLALAAVLLAPDTLLLLLAGAVVLITRGRRRAVGGVLLASGCAVGFVVVAVLLGAEDRSSEGAPLGAVAAVAVAVLLVAALGARWRPEHLPLEVAAAATAATCLMLGGRLPTLLVSLPGAALLAGLLAAGPVVALIARRNTLRRAVAVAGATLLVAAATAAVLAPGQASPSAPAPGRPGTSTAAPATVLRWAAAELPRGAVLTAPPGLAAELRHAGGSPQQVRIERTGVPTSPGTFLVTDGGVPAGGRVVGRFPDPSARATILVVDPAPGIPTSEEVRRRQAIAMAVLANPTTRTTPDAAARLRSADVDPRLLSLVAALAARSGVGIAAFPAPLDTPSAGLLARRGLIDTVGGQPVSSGSPATEDLVTWLRAQLPPYTPDSITVSHDGVLIGFRYASAPDALVSQASH